MPSRSSKPIGQAPASGQKIEKKAQRSVAKITEQRFAETGSTTRVQAHVSSRGKRNQAKRDSR